MSILKNELNNGRFVCVLEVLSRPSSYLKTELNKVLQRGHIAGWRIAPAFADRVGKNWEWDSLDGVEDLGNPTTALLHFSGKNRTSDDLLQQLTVMRAKGLSQLLLLSGDRFPTHHINQEPVRYLESVPALQMVREHCSDWFLGAALNPFKYCEEEGGAQYFKATKKLLASADFLTLQLGFDVTKHLEALQWMRAQNSPKPMIASVMPLTKNRARFLKNVPGIVITPSMLQFLEQEESVTSQSAQVRSLERLALQIIGLEKMGYAGVHISGLHTLAEVLELEAMLLKKQERFDSLDDWTKAWQASWYMSDGSEVSFLPDGHNWKMGQTNVLATRKEQLRYKAFSTLHDQLFNQKRWFSKLFGWCVVQPVWQAALPARVLHLIERKIKKPLVGCDTCGQCRLAETLYVCPETCPKGLANGPCGGTQLNRCEFGDRECIHNVKYRVARSMNLQSVLTRQLIPAVNEEQRHQSSWPGWFKSMCKHMTKKPYE